jgi:hypothetical protein
MQEEKDSKESEENTEKFLVDQIKVDLIIDSRKGSKMRPWILVQSDSVSRRISRLSTGQNRIDI